jgi:hypothetical protein
VSTARKFQNNDTEGWGQEGNPLNYIVSEVLQEDMDDPEELVSEECWLGDGEDALYDVTSWYIRSPRPPKYGRLTSSI